MRAELSEHGSFLQNHFRALAHAQVGRLDVGCAAVPCRCPAGRSAPPPARSPCGDLQRLEGVLLDQEDRRAVARDLLDGGKYLADQDRRQTQTARPSAGAWGGTSGRAMASICCCPPERSGYWVNRSLSTGKSEQTESSSLPEPPCRGAGSRQAEFSPHVSWEERRRSGTSAMPDATACRDRFHGGRLT